MSYQPSYLDAMQGVGEQRTKLYLTYSDGAARQCAKSLGGAASFAGRQAKAVRG